MLIMWLFPLVFLLSVYFAISPVREAERGGLSFQRQSFVFSVLFVPWIVVQLSPGFDIWLLSLVFAAGLSYFLLYRHVTRREAWIKGFVSTFLGFLFLEVSLHPGFGLALPMEYRLKFSVTAAAYVCGLFLLYGLPPLQLGVVDIGSEGNSAVQVPLNFLLRLVTTFVVLMATAFSPWVENLGDLHVFMITVLAVGLGFSRVVLRLQTSPFRMMSYLLSGFLLPLIVRLVAPEFADPLFIIIALFYAGLYAILDQRGAADGRGEDRLNWTLFKASHPVAALRIERCLRGYFGLEALLLLVIAVLSYRGAARMATAPLALAVLCSLAVMQDKSAFKARERALAS